jgi:hypothetical protein
VPASDIALGPGANGGIASPNLISASYSGTQLSLRLAASPVPLTLEVYLFGANDRVFQATMGLAANQTLVTLNVPGLANGDQIIATATDSANDTSAFSNAALIANPFVVINTNDSGSGSLRAAITNSISSPGTPITFNIPENDPGFNSTTKTFTINLKTKLPDITQKITIDATTQPEFTTKPVVEVFGGNIGGTADGLLLAHGSDSSKITGLDLAGFNGAGIHIQSNNVVIVGNFLGTDITGKAAGPGNVQGILVDTGTGNVIGGTATGSPNTIGFNNAGVVIQSDSNSMIGNFVGTDATGANLGNTIGVSIFSSSNTVGGTATGSPNTVGNSATNVFIQPTGTGNAVEGNFIGTDAAGHNLGVSGSYGVRVLGTGNTIGGSASSSRNTIGFNSAGVSLEGTGNTVEGNVIGTDGAGNNRGNVVGVSVSAARNTIGGAAADTIAFNSTAGMAISGDSNVVRGELIGTDAGGSSLGNAVGVLVSGAGNTIGGTTSGDGNIIGANKSAGLSISGSSNLVEGNLIGTDAARHNLNNVIGVLITGAGNTIGGTTAPAANIIGRNSAAGIQINGGLATGNLVAGNDIGTDSASASAPPLPNGYNVQFLNATGNTIGGTAAGEGNVIGPYGTAGIAVLSGMQVEIHGNTYTSTTPNPTPPPAGNPTITTDIAVAPGANNDQPAPVLLGTNIVTSTTPAQLQVFFTDGANTSGVSLDIYRINPNTGVLDFLGAAPATSTQGGLTVSIPIPSGVTLSTTDVIVATATVASNGTSGFSSVAPINPFAVLNTNDSGAGSLRQAIANAEAALETVKFAIPNTDPTVLFPPAGFIIHLKTPLDITSPITIDGFSEAKSLGLGNIPLIVLDGDSITSVDEPAPLAPAPAVLAIEGTAAGTVVQGLVFNSSTQASDGSNTNFSAPNALLDAAILIRNNNPADLAHGTQLLGNYIGTEVTASILNGNPLGFRAGIELDGSSYVTIGGPDGDQLNVISGMRTDLGADASVLDGEGIVLVNGSTHNLIQNDYIGTDFTGESSGPALWNNTDDIRLNNSSNNTIGMPNTTGPDGPIFGRNVVSGAGFTGTAGINYNGDGIVLENGSTYNLVQDAFIGTDYAGTHSDGNLANLGDAVFISDSSYNQIGAQTDSSAAIMTLNLFSGNIGDGVRIASSAAPTNPSTAVGNQVVNTYIGTDITGSASNTLLQLGNSGDGIALEHAQGATVGPATVSVTQAVVDPTAGTISINYAVTGQPNESYTIGFFTTTSNPSGGSTSVFLGQATTGPLTLATQSFHAVFDLANVLPPDPSLPTNPIVTASTPKNLISGNFGNGISIANSSAVVVRYNYVGLDATGLFSNTDLSNTLDGVLVKDSSGIAIGGTAPGSANVISGNLEAGIRITGSPGLASTGANLIEGNKIGTTASGNSDIANGTNGIEIAGSPDNTIGGQGAGAGNVVTGNNGNGVVITGIFDQGVPGNRVFGNTIGAATATSQTAGNALNGISLVNTSRNVIGTNGSSTGASNFIAGNGFGSFTRTQLFGTGKTNASRAFLTDSYLGIAAGTYSNDLSYRVVVSQQIITFPNESAILGDKQLLLFTIDATGAGSNEPERLDLTGLASFLSLSGPPDQYQFAVTTGKFLNTIAPDNSTADDVLLIVTDLNTKTSTAYLLKLVDTNNVLSFNTTPPFATKPPFSSVSLGGVAGAVAVGSFMGPGPGKLDGFAVAVTTSGGQQQVEVFADPTASTPSSTLPITGSIDDVIATDFSALDPSVKAGGKPDGFADLAVADGTNHRIDVFNNQGGSFSSPPIKTDLDTVLGTTVTPSLIGAGRFEQNPLLPVPNYNMDVVVVDSQERVAYVLKQQSDGTFTPFLDPTTKSPKSYAVGLNPTAVLVGDFEGNGIQDITILSAGNSTTPGTITELSGLGDGTFRTPTNFDAGLSPTGMAEQFVPGATAPVIVVSNELVPTGAGNPSPLQLRINLRQFSAQHSNGVAITGSTSGANTIGGNNIGIDVSGSTSVNANQARPNAANGILIAYDNSAPSSPPTPAGNLVANNIISGNANNGILLSGHYINPPSSTELNQIVGNFIGTDSTGELTFDAAGLPLGNSLDGIRIQGLAASISGNVIAGNGLSGIDAQRVVDAAGDVSTSLSQMIIVANFIGTDASGTQTMEIRSEGASPPLLLPLGNSLDGILLDNVNDVMIGGVGTVTIGGTVLPQRNVISGNTGRGIEVRGDLVAGTGRDIILRDYIGTDKNGTSVTQGGNPSYILGNLSDGIFLLDSQATSITGALVSGNRGFGIHAAGRAGQATDLSIGGNKVGTDITGTTSPTSFGNGSDGIFLDRITTSTIGGTVTVGGTVYGGPNIISGNRSNGIDLLDSSGILIVGNLIGTGIAGTERLGNAASGIFVNESSNITIGGVTSTPGAAPGNVISSNQVYGVALSALAGATTASNVAEGNSILGNGVSGVLINNATQNMIGGSAPGSGNVISANQLYGIEVNGIDPPGTRSTGNKIFGNFIGTDSSGGTAIGNGSDGIFMNNAAGNSIGGSGALDGNVISGNAGNGVHIFGGNAAGNTVVNNEVGLDSSGSKPIPNAANGFLIDNAGFNIVGGTTADLMNVISGNHQSGVMIISSTGSGGSTVEGNRIGTDRSGSFAIGNSGNGVFIYGSSNNTIGGNTATPGTAPGNLISGNAQAGVAIFSPAKLATASGNLVGGNEIGTNAAGSTSTGSDGKSLGNKSDGIDIFSGQSNRVGQAGSRNVISGNDGNGILIAKISDVEATGNLVNQNYIGTKADGMSVLPNGKDGVLVQNAYGNTIGVASSGVIQNVKAPTSPSNVISGNLASGIEFSDLAEDMPGNTVQGNFIGVSKDGTGSLGNVFAGVFVNNLGGFSSKEQIGGTGAGIGNIIAGSPNGYGINIVGPVTDSVPANNVVQGNLIGLDRNGNAVNNNSATPASNNIGIYLQNSSGNMIGGSADARNVISANTKAGIELTGLFSTRNVIQGNQIGTTLDGNGRPGSSHSVTSVTAPTQDATSPLQFYGVYIATPSPTFDPRNKQANNLILNNQISGNMEGIDITGVGSGTNTTGQGVPFGRNIVAGNLIGTDSSGNAANPNFEYGVYINNSAANTVGGGNLISANGVSGVEIVGGTPQTTSGRGQSNAAAARNFIIGNTIGYNSAGGPGFTVGSGASLIVPDGPTVTLGRQLYGVVVIGSSSNIIGAKKQGNLIGGNVSTGVYITVQDFKGNVYSTPTNNTLNSNTIVNNGQYGVYRFESPKNSVAERPQRHANKFASNPIALADFLKNVGVNTLPAPKSKYGSKAHRKSIKKAHPKPIKVTHSRPHKHHVTGHGQPGVSLPARPRIPALFELGLKTIRIEHVPARRLR